MGDQHERDQKIFEAEFADNSVCVVRHIRRLRNSDLYLRRGRCNGILEGNVRDIRSAYDSACHCACSACARCRIGREGKLFPLRFKA